MPSTTAEQKLQHGNFTGIPVDGYGRRSIDVCLYSTVGYLAPDGVSVQREELVSDVALHRRHQRPFSLP